MEEERIFPARENPRNFGEFSNGISNKAMPVESAVHKGSPTIVDRFKAILRDREEEIRVSVDDEVPPPSTEEIVALYELVLAELTFNSKPIITDLTIIAGEQREHGDGIAEAICARIVEVQVEQKLPSLYLLDSIVKNIGHEYVRYFSSRLPEVFCEAYWQVHYNLHPAMRHLFGTWSTVFPPSVLGKIQEQLRFSQSASHQSSAGPTSLSAAESPRLSHGIHVNPKYLEARRQFEHSTVDINNQHVSGASSTLKIFGHKPAIGYDDYDSDNAEVMSSQVGAQRLSSSGHAGRIFTLGAEKLLPSSASRLAKSSTWKIEQGRSLSPSGDEFAVNNSPSGVDRASPSHFGLEHGLGKVPGRKDSSGWPRNQWANGTNRRFEPATSHHNGAELQGPRALIDAYGNDERIRNPNSKPLMVDINGIDTKVGTKIWQSTEEEEFDWEDMSPTLVNFKRSNDLLSSSISPLESFRIRPGYGKQSAAPLDTDFRGSNLSCQAQNAVVNDSPIVLAHAGPTVISGRGASSKITSLCDMEAQLQGSCYPRQALNFPQNLARSSQRSRNSGGSARNFRMLPSSVERKLLVDPFLDADAQCCGWSAAASRMGVVSVDSWKPELLSASVLPSTGALPAVNIQKCHPLLMRPPLPFHKPSNSQFDSMNTDNAVSTQDLNKSFLPEHQFNNIKNKALSSVELPVIPNKQAGPFPSNAAQKPEQLTSYGTQLLLSQEVHQNLVTPAAVPAVVSMPSLLPPLAHEYSIQGYNTTLSNVPFNPISGMHPSMPSVTAPNSSIHLPGGGLLPLPQGPHTAPSQMFPTSHIAPDSQSGSGFSGLISSLMAQGLISLTNQASVQDSVGLDFNPDILKVHHESAITALYSDLPRQCTTCGLRFKCQEEHSVHMDWHVTKNRISKNHKQKPSRKWFVCVNMWLTGAEALGTDAVPGFLLAEGVVAKKDDKDLAVPADEDQNVCALCGEPFDDFYSDKTEEWMYKGAVYMNATSGSTAGVDRSELGPIVHAKCRSESSVVSPEDFGQDAGEYAEEGSQRKKRLRS